MRNIVLSLVMVAVLAAAGIGGTLGTWSDSETSAGNTITTGSVDLKVNGADDLPWGTGVPTKVDIDCMVPDRLYGPYEVELWNAGICDTPSLAFIHIKDVCCSNAPPKEGSGYLCPQTGDLKPEPELVAEFGGKVDCRMVDGIGEAVGDTCSMASHTTMTVTDEAGNVLIGPAKLIDLLCQEIPLFELVPCEPRTIYLWFELLQESEEDYGFDYFADPGDPGYDALEWTKFNDWPSWAMMRDVVMFSMEFDLLLENDDA